MNRSANNRDLQILSSIAKYKFLTVKQFCALQQRSIQVIRRRLRFLRGNGFISIMERVFGPGPGRNEHIIILSAEGIKLLRPGKIINNQTKYVSNQSYDSALIEHDLLLNWFLIHLTQLERLEARFKVSTIATNQQHLFHVESIQSIEMVQNSKSAVPDDKQTLIPDAVFYITDTKMKKSLLFFLEVDRGTEALSSTVNNQQNIEEKINAYQSIFRAGIYKHYKRITRNELNGFRLLFLTNTDTRMKAICRITRNMPPSDFVWVTNQDLLFKKGAAAKIWYRGGDLDKPSESILNEKLAFDSPIVIKK